MKPDRKEYSLDEVALMKAEIEPMMCRDSVQCAIKRQLPGCYKAEACLMQLYEQVEAGLLKPAKVIEPPSGVMGSDEIYISKEDAENWKPEALPIQPANSKSNSSNELTGKSRTSFLNLIKALCLLVARYESGQSKPKHFENRKIILDTGRISAEALRELLQTVDPDTPNRAEELIKEAMKQAD